MKMVFTHKKMVFATVVLLSLMIIPVRSYALTVNYEPGVTQYVDSVIATIHGDDMAGMQLTAFFTDSTSETVTWGATGTGAGAAFGSGWSMSVAGDTFAYWTLTNDSNLSIDHILLDGFSGGTTFDTYISQHNDTPNSAHGWPFSLLGQVDPFDPATANDPFGITATYSGIVALTDSSPMGDEFRFLDIAFAIGFGPGSSLEFIIDTDGFTPAPVPEPGTLLLFGTGLAGFIGSRSRKKN